MYFDLGHVIWLLIAGVGAGIWWRLREGKERAYRAARAHCEQMGVQLLDYSVYDSQFSVARDTRGKLSIKRSFLFEFSSTGDERYFGKVSMTGRRIDAVQLEPHRI